MTQAKLNYVFVFFDFFNFSLFRLINFSKNLGKKKLRKNKNTENRVTSRKLYVQLLKEKNSNSKSPSRKNKTENNSKTCHKLLKKRNNLERLMLNNEHNSALDSEECGSIVRFFWASSQKNLHILPSRAQKNNLISQVATSQSENPERKNVWEMTKKWMIMYIKSLLHLEKTPS